MAESIQDTELSEPAFEETVHFLAGINLGEQDFHDKITELITTKTLQSFLLNLFLKRYGHAAAALASPCDSLDTSGRDHFAASKAERVLNLYVA